MRPICGFIEIQDDALGEVDELLAVVGAGFLVNVADVDGIQVLEMKQEIGDSEYVTWIYWDDGSIRELFTDTSSGLGLADGLEILECQGLKLSKDGRLLRIETVGEGGGSLELSLRSGGLETDE